MVFKRKVVGTSHGVLMCTARLLKWQLLPALVFNGLQGVFAPSPGVGDYVMRNGCILRWADKRGFSDLVQSSKGEALTGEASKTGYCIFECLKALELRMPDTENPKNLELYTLMDRRNESFVGCADICPQNIQVKCDNKATFAENKCKGNGPATDAKGTDLGTWTLEIESHKGASVWVNFKNLPRKSELPNLAAKWENAFGADPGISYVVDIERSSSLLFLKDELDIKQLKDNIQAEDPLGASQGSQKASNSANEEEDGGEKSGREEQEESPAKLQLGENLGHCEPFAHPLEKEGVHYKPLKKCPGRGEFCNLVVEGMSSADASEKKTCHEFCGEYSGFKCDATYDVEEEGDACDALHERTKAHSCDSYNDNNVVLCSCVSESEGGRKASTSSSEEDELEGVEVEVTPEDLRGTTCSMSMMAPTICSDVFCCDCPETMELVVVTKVYKSEQRAIPWVPTTLRNLLACACSFDEENPTPANVESDKQCECEPGSIDGKDPPEPIEKGDGFYCPSPETHSQDPWKLWKEGGEQGENWLTKPFGKGPNGDWEMAHKLWMEKNGHWFAKEEAEVVHAEGGSEEVEEEEEQEEEEEEDEGKKKKGKREVKKKSGSWNFRPLMLVLPLVVAFLF